MRKSEISYLSSRMVIEDAGSVYAFDYREIYCIVYRNSYTVICTANKEKMITYSLTKLQENLPPIFFSCNKSTLVNLSYVKSIEYNKNNSVLELCNNTQFNVSRRKRKELKLMMVSVIEGVTCKDCFLCNVANSTL